MLTGPGQTGTAASGEARYILAHGYEALPAGREHLTQAWSFLRNVVSPFPPLALRSQGKQLAREADEASG
jgi:hypothetical protein